MSRSSWRPLSGGMSTARNRYIPHSSTHQWGLTDPARKQRVTFPLYIQTTFNHISRMLSRQYKHMLACHPKRSAAFFTLLRMIWNCRIQVYTEYRTNVVRSIVNRRAGLLRPGGKKTCRRSGLDNTSQQWLRTHSMINITSTSRKPKPSSTKLVRELDNQRGDRALSQQHEEGR
jgi:hypothetical protein